MHHTLSRRRGRIVPAAVMAAAILFAAPAPAWAASHGTKGGGGGHGGGGGAGSATGNDISWPQCGATYPTGQAFGIVGVNDGLANNYNPCFSSEDGWALGSSGLSSQPKASLYVNTADPGNSYNGQPIADWPTSGSTPYGTCTTAAGGLGSNTTACAWQYGYNLATKDIDAIGASIAASQPWWLDVETANSWQSGSYGLEMNVADLQGMEAAFAGNGIAAAGIYTTSSQWTTITGGDHTDFAGVPDWVPGAQTERGAQSNCSQTPFTGTGSKITITQWTGSVDYDYPCP